MDQISPHSFQNNKSKNIKEKKLGKYSLDFIKNE